MLLQLVQRQVFSPAPGLASAFSYLSSQSLLMAGSGFKLSAWFAFRVP
jgi:hypothetical protein